MSFSDCKTFGANAADWISTEFFIIGRQYVYERVYKFNKHVGNRKSTDVVFIVE